MMLTGILILVGLSLGLVSYFFWRKNTVVTNHYTREKQKTEPSLGKNPLANVRFDSHETEDPDTVLGIKPQKNEKQPVAEKTTETQTVVLYLMSPKEAKYTGYELLQAMLSTGLRFGDRHIFHRHIHKDGRGDILFHCASAEKPGTFDISKIGDFETAGLCFFFITDSVHDPIAVFDTMLDTIDQLVEDLGGEVLDDKRRPFTKENMIKIRQQLRCFVPEPVGAQ